MKDHIEMYAEAISRSVFKEEVGYLKEDASEKVAKKIAKFLLGAGHRDYVKNVVDNDLDTDDMDLSDSAAKKFIKASRLSKKDLADAQEAADDMILGELVAAELERKIDSNAAEAIGGAVQEWLGE